MFARNIISNLTYRKNRFFSTLFQKSISLSHVTYSMDLFLSSLINRLLIHLPVARNLKVSVAPWRNIFFSKMYQKYIEQIQPKKSNFLQIHKHKCSRELSCSCCTCTNYKSRNNYTNHERRVIPVVTV